ncbi:MAG TPA: DNA repair exonuclease [Candidatus Binatia bacterium]
MPRVRLLHTSDVHLRPDRPERRRALEKVFAEAVARNADGVIVAGDLFDRAADVVAERAAVRKMVQEIAPRPVIFVPGNHDPDAYASSADFGANAVVLAKTPYARARACGLDFVGVPYQHGRTVAECLTGLSTDPRHTVVVAHATLVDGVADAFVGDGEEGAFMPVFAPDVTRRCCYAALGHVHAGRHLAQREGERLIAYPGSPVTTSARELGPRGVLVVDLEPGVGVLAHEQVALATPYHERVEVSCIPGAEREAVEQLAKQAAALKGPGVRVIARLTGASVEPESTLRESANRALALAWGMPVPSATPPRAAVDDDAASFPILELSVASFPQLAQIPVVSEFVTRLVGRARERGDDPATVARALRMGLAAFQESLP